MGKVAKDAPQAAKDLPETTGNGSAGPDGATQAASPARTGRLTSGLPLAEVLRVPSLAGSRVLAGLRGLHRRVSRLNVMEVPDILPWVKPDELLLTTGYPLRETPEALSDLVAALDARGVAALGVKLGRYLDELPEAMLARADELGFPVIQLPRHVAFDDVLNQVLTDVLNEQAAMLARSEEVHRALVQAVLAGGGVAEVCAELARLLDALVLVTSPDGRVLTRAGDESLAAEIDGGPCFDGTGRFRTEWEVRGVSTHEGMPGSHAIVPVVAGSHDHGRLVAFARRHLLDSDVHVLEVASTVVALAITKARAVAAVEEKYSGDFLRDILAGRAGSPADVVAHAASLGWDLERPVVVVVAELDPVASDSAGPRALDGLALRPVRERFAAAWRAVLSARDPRAAVGSFNKEVVAIIGVPRAEALQRVVRDMVTAVAGDGGGGRQPFSTGVSRVIESVLTAGPDALPKAYEQARTAVRVGRHLHGTGTLAHFDNLGVLRLLSLIPDGREVDAFVEETLKDLARTDDPESADLRRTLRVLLDHNLNVAEAARELHFHYNTLRYRIGKLERILGPFTEDPKLRLDIMLALQVVSLREGGPDGCWPRFRPA